MEKLVKRLAFNCAKLKNKRKSNFSDDFKISYYVFQGIFSDLSKILVALLINILMGTTLELLIIVMVFGGLRYFTGGFHANSFNSCFVITLVFYTIPCLLAKYIQLNLISIIILLIIFLLIDLKYAPRFLIEVDYKKKIKNKIVSLVYIVVLTVIAYVTGLTAIIVSLALQIITITPIMYKMNELINNRGIKTT